MNYDFAAIEKKWQANWEKTKPYAAITGDTRPKFYGLIEFPYPSGQGLHVGHPRPFTAMDIVTRKKRMQGYNVLFPIGFDAFGLPTENYAIKNHIHPAIVTKNNIENFTKQLKMLGYGFDWDRCVDTTDPKYYKWTQWAFLKMFGSYYCRDRQQARPIGELEEAFARSGTEGVNAACTAELHFTAADWAGMDEHRREQVLQNYRLAYRADTMVNWCPQLGTVLANDEVKDGLSVRGGYPVVQKRMKQWLLRVTAYAQRMLDGLETLQWSESLKEIQRNWIGRSHGAEVNFGTTAGDTLTVYTTRCDTLFGATYMVVSPEHAMVKEWLEKGIIKNADAVTAYQAEAARKSDFERSELNKEKTGVKLEGVMGINPVNDKQIPIFISDYVLSTYGTGAIMAVPAHDTRDWEFAKKFGLPIIEVVKGNTESNLNEAAFTDVATGTLVNSGFLDGLSVTDAKKKMIEWLEANGKGCDKVNYKLRDWVFSRQRYWGEPIPMVKCEKCGWQPLPESSLPLTLPDITDFEPGPDGESPLARHTDWVKTTCPCCGGPATRETDTMPQWAGSSWYFLRYMDPHCKDALASKEALEYWSPVDWYNGGMEHTTLHLLYSRFWHKFLYDIGAVPSPEPYQKRTAHGMILGLNPHSFVNLPAEEQEKLLKEYGSQKAAEKALEEKYGEMARHPIVKMSKSLGNVINPDEVVDQYGADTMRLYEMFMGDFEQAAPWQTSAIAGCNRFLDRVWTLSDKLVEGEGYRPAIETLMHQTIKKVGTDIEGLKMNTAIAQLMTLVNALYDNGGATKAELETVVQLLNPFAPHMTEELWEKLGHSHNEQLAYYPWPQYEEAKCVESTVEIAVQVNGKVKARLKVAADIDAAAAIAAAKADPAVAAALEGKQVVKEIYVKGRLVNLAVK